MHEVVGLQQHVREFRVADPVVTLEPAANGVLAHHVVDSQVLADVAKKLEVPKPAQPVGVVDQHRVARTVAKIEESRQLSVNSGDIGSKRRLIQQVALETLAAGIADQAGRAADQHDRPMASPLQPHQQHQWHQVPDVQARRGRIKAGVGRDDLLAQQLGEPCPIRYIRQEAAQGKLVENVHGRIEPNPSRRGTPARPQPASAIGLREHEHLGEGPSSERRC
jgi:hypothetical protein